MSVPFHPFRPFDCWGRRRAANRFVPAMLADYAVPPMPALPQQLLPNPGLDDPAAWTVAGGWSLAGAGATHTPNIAWSRLTPLGLALPAAATDLVFAFEVPAQTTASATLGPRGLIVGNTSTNNQYLGWIAPHNVIGPRVSHIRGRTAAQTNFQIEGGYQWGGSIDNIGLYDVSASRDKPTIVLQGAGQSNIEIFGEGPVIPALDRWHPDIWVCSPVNYSYYGATKDILTVAQEPLCHNGNQSHKAGGLMAAARRIVSLTGGAVRVVIVPCAKTATALIGADAPWNPDTTQTDANLRLYARLIATTQAAISQISNLLGVCLLWSQGEADGNNMAQYPAAFAAFMQRLRTDLNRPDLPAVVMGAVIPNPAAPSNIVTTQRTLDQDSGSPNAVSGVRYFDGPIGQQWINTSDAVHYTVPAQRVRFDYAGQLVYGIGQARGWWT